MSKRRGFFILCLLTLHLGLASHALAVITRLTPLKSIIDDSDHIVVATIEAIDPARPSITLTITTDLKGAPASRRLPILLKGDSEGDPKQVLDRVKVGTTLIVFITELPDRHMGLVFSEGSWFQIIGQLVEGAPRWGFTHGEPYLRRTFKGTTDEMKQTIAAYLKDKKDPPAVSPDEKPGLGPTLDGITAKVEPEKDGETKPVPAPTQSKDDSGRPIALSPKAIQAETPAKNESILAWVIGGIVFVLAAALLMSFRKKPK